MTQSTTLTIRVSEETKAKLDKLAEATRRSKSSLANEAVEIYVAREWEIVAGILAARESMKRGEGKTMEEVFERIDAKLKAMAAKQKQQEIA